MLTVRVLLILVCHTSPRGEFTGQFLDYLFIQNSFSLYNNRMKQTRSKKRTQRKSRRHMRKYAGGGLPTGAGFPLSYTTPSYKEPSASAGSNLQISEPGLARPVLNPTSAVLRGGRRRKTQRKQRNRKNLKVGGFYPSVMGSFLQNAAGIVPATIYSGYKLFKNDKKN